MIDYADWLRYDSDTGYLYWIKDRYRAKAGSKAGYVRPDGYVIVTVRGHTIRAHRLAWFLYYGQMPDKEIDHIDGNPTNNIIGNLRLASRSQNVANTRKKASSKNRLKGVTKTRHNRYRAQIRRGGVNQYIGTFKTEELAHAAYKAAAEKEFGAFARAES
jgi:hypothetical protein